MRRVFSNHTIVEDPKDEATAVGAARRGIILSRPEVDFICGEGDSSPLGLGIVSNVLPIFVALVLLWSLGRLANGICQETADGLMANIAPRGILPYWASCNFTTAVDGQSSMLIRVLQGERVLATNNLLIGEFEFPVTPARAGVSRVQILIIISVRLSHIL